MLTFSWCNFNFQWSKWIDYCENWIKVANIGHSTINTLLLLRLLTVRILQEGQTHFTYYLYYIGDLNPFWLFCLKALWFSCSQRFLNDLAFKYYLLWASPDEGYSLSVTWWGLFFERHLMKAILWASPDEGYSLSVTWWRLFLKRVLRTESDIYVFIFIYINDANLHMIIKIHRFFFYLGSI
jgi:hypothetical protein